MQMKIIRVASIQTCVHLIKAIINKTDVIESCSRERLRTKTRFYKLLNLTVFTSLLKGVPMLCNDAILPRPKRKITQSTVSRLKRAPDNHKRTTCVFFVLLLSICTAINDWQKKLRSYWIYSSKKGWIERRSIPGSPFERYSNCWKSANYQPLNILLYDTDFVDSNNIGEFAKRSVQEYENTERLLR